MQFNRPDAVAVNCGGQFRRAQWRVLLATIFCYLFYYTGRQTFGFAIPGIQQEFGVSKTHLGWVSAAMLWTYAIGQAINGNLGDQFGGRRMMSLGAVLSCGLNWLLSFATDFRGLLTAWAANGYAQSMGWAPGSRVLSNWWGSRHRGRVYGAYVFAAGMSSVLAFATSGLILSLHLDWRWIFRLPVLFLLLGGVVYFALVRDRPEDRGFPPLDYEGEPIIDHETSTVALSHEGLLARYRFAFSNRPFLLACAAIGFQSCARYGLLIWVPVHLLGANWREDTSGKWVSLALPLGMAAGALVSGWLSDRVFAGKRSMLIVVSMGLAACMALGMYLLQNRCLAGIPLLFLCGFFAYGPQAAFWALCPDLLGRRRAGTGTGIMDAFAYVFAGLGEPLIGWTIEYHSGQTAIVFLIVATSCVCSAVLASFIRR